MAVSRNTFDPTKNYKKVVYHEDRTLLDSELNEQQDIAREQVKRLADALFREGAVLSGLDVARTNNVLQIAAGRVYVDGCIENVPGATLAYDVNKHTGADYVYVELLKYNYTYNHDGVLVNPATGEPTAEREKWVTSLKNRDTSGDALPANVVQRKVVCLYKFERDTGDVLPAVQQKCNIALEDFAGTLAGARITVGSVTENQLAFAAAEGLSSLLNNLAERTFDQAGNYLVNGLDSFTSGDDGQNVKVVTNAGRAYIQGYRLQKELPTTTLVPKSVSTKFVRGEQKTFQEGVRRYALNSGPLKATTQVEAIVETTSSITRGSVSGGEDLLEPNPVVDIVEVSQGATVFLEGVDWQQSGNYVDWLGQNEPAIGTSYTVRWTYTRQMEKGTDYCDGGLFGQSGCPAAGLYHYLVTVVTVYGESGYDSTRVVSRQTGAGEINRLSWTAVPGAVHYRVYRGVSNTRTGLQLLYECAGTALSYDDDGADEPSSANPLQGGTAGIGMSPVSIALGNLNVVNFGKPGVGIQPVAGSNCSIDYDFYIGRRDVLCATASEIIRIPGAPAEFPKDPVVPENALALCSITCPPNSTAMTVRNFGLTRVTMDQLHRLMRDIETLKYNDAISQMNTQLQNRTAETKKGIYSDDFSNTAQSDPTHPNWNARVDTLQKFVAPARTATPYLLEVDPAHTTVRLGADLAMLPATEVVLVEQLDWSEERNVNPWSAFDKPPASITVSPTMGRRGQTTIGVNGINFSRNASNVTLRCDGQVVATGITTDWSGRFSGTFLVPNSAALGNRIVSATDGAYGAEAVVQVQDPVVITRIQTIVEQRVIRVPAWDWVWWWRQTRRPVDPLAQTFNFTQNRVVSAVGLFFTTKDAEKPVTVQIRGVTTGFPNAVVYAETTLAPDEVNLNAETKVVFPNPVYIEADTSYAVVILTDSNDYRLRVAMLGAIGQNGVITKQVYPQGVLLESSNAETWNARQGADLAMRIYGLNFASSGVIQFMPTPYTGYGFTEINLDEYSVIPEGANIVWEYSQNDGYSWDVLVPAEEEKVPWFNVRHTIRARLTSTLPNESPVLNFRNVTMVGYLNDWNAAYVTRQIELTQGVASTTVYAEMNVPSHTTITWYASNDGGTSWEPMTLDGTRPISQEWTEYTYKRTFYNPAGNKVRYMAVFWAGWANIFARIHRLGATLA
ncbi:MAG TPA: DUF4815 domain-containing protein [Candidatus Hydrogenedentes bacterium]|nr:DUF4815 domain-containing protein [Candidatus Hydrogenedentota bacterium]